MIDGDVPAVKLLRLELVVGEYTPVVSFISQRTFVVGVKPGAGANPKITGEGTIGVIVVGFHSGAGFQYTTAVAPLEKHRPITATFPFVVDIGT